MNGSSSLESLGARLRRFRHQAGLSLQQAGERARMSDRMVQWIENGVVMATYQQVKALMDAYDSAGKPGEQPRVM